MSFLTDLAQEALNEKQQRNGISAPAQREDIQSPIQQLATEAISQRNGTVIVDGRAYPGIADGPTQLRQDAKQVAAGSSKPPPEEMRTVTMSLDSPDDIKNELARQEAQADWDKLNSLKTFEEKEAFARSIDDRIDRKAKMTGVDRQKTADEKVYTEIRGQQDDVLAKENNKIGLTEQALRFQNYKNAIPFLGSANQALETYTLNQAISRVVNGQTSIDKEPFLRSWLGEQSEIASRGKDMEAQVFDTTVNMIPYAIEWAKTAGLQATMATFGKKLTLKFFGPIMRVATEKLPAKILPVAARGAVGAIDLSKAAGTAVGMTAGSPGRVAATYQQNRMPKEIDFDQSGKLVIKREGDGRVTAMTRALAYELGQNLTEQSGEFAAGLGKSAFKAVGKGLATASRKVGINPGSLAAKANKVLPLDVWSGISKAAKIANDKVPAVQTINSALKAMKWDGFIGENLEEFLASFYTALTDTNPQQSPGKPLIQRLVDAIPTKEQLGVQAASLAVPGAVKGTVGTVVDIHNSDVMKNKRDKARSFILSPEGAQWLWQSDPAYAKLLTDPAGTPSQKLIKPLQVRLNKNERGVLADNLREIKRSLINQRLADKVNSAQAESEIENTAPVIDNQPVEEIESEAQSVVTPAPQEKIDAQPPVNVETPAKTPETIEEYENTDINKDTDYAEGDRIEFWGGGGKKLTGTIKNFSKFGTEKIAVINTDQTVNIGSRPIGRIENRPLGKIIRKLAPASEEEASPPKQINLRQQFETVPIVKPPIDEVQPQVEKPKRKSVIEHLSSDKQARVQQLLKELSEKNKLTSGIDPSDMAKAFELTSLFIEAGARTFAEYSRQVIAHTGEWFKPYLKAAYNGARDWPGMEQYHDEMTPYEDVRNSDIEKILSDDIIEENKEKQGEPAQQQTESTARRGDDQGGLDEQRVVHNGQRTLDKVSSESSGGTDGGGIRRSVDRGGTGSQEAGRSTEETELQRSGGDEHSGEGVPDTAGLRRQRGRGRGRAGRVRPLVNEKAGGLNYIITEKDDLGSGGAKTKTRANLEAISLLKKLVSENRKATAQEQSVLVKYVGWGGIKQIFNPKDTNWTGEYNQLKEILSKDEYEAAKRSVLNAHYTSVNIIQGMWDGIKTLGFDGGSICEPAMGIGHFFGLLPASIAQDSKLFGVELDKITAQIAQQLYQNADIQNKPFEKTIYPDNFFDLMISNVPFGDINISDTRERELGKLRAAIHDYFFAKAVKKTRPGGLVVFITSHHTLDKKDSSQRRAWEDMGANFVGAIRLPFTAFKSNAGTEVVTDIIILQKRSELDAIESKPFKESVATQIGEHEFNINEYFLANPGHVLGKHAATGSMYRGNSYNVEPANGIILRDRIGEILGSLNINRSALDAIMTRTAEMARPDYWGTAPENMRPFALTVQDGVILQKKSNDLVRVVVTERGYDNKVQRLEIALKVRDAINKLLNLQRDINATDEEVGAGRKLLNAVYDDFVNQYGPLNKPYNKGTYELDPDAPLLRSLEDYDSDTGLAQKAEVFFTRTQTPHKIITSASGPSEALSISLAERGKVDIDYMSSLTGITGEAIINELGTQIYQNPVTGDWELAGLYLSGNVRAKLSLAQEIAKQDKNFNRNVEALKAVQPEDVPPGKIGVRLGSPWIPTHYYESFIHELIGRKAGLRFNKTEGTWVVETDRSRNYNTNEVETFGTPDIPAMRLIEKIFNYRDIAVYRKIGDDKILDPIATAAAQAKAESIKQAFLKWIWREPNRTADLVRKYNDTYNNIVFPTFDGAHLNFPGMNIEIQKKFRDYQKNAVWRTLTTGNTLLAHVVGAGKTWTMVAAAMEMKRLGLAKRPVFVVPNHLIEQWPKEFLRIYPGAKLLGASTDDFSPQKRQTLISRIMTGDWDAIIVPATSFEKIPLSPQKIEAFYKSQIDALEDEIHKAKQDKGKENDNYVRELEAAKARLEQKLDEMSAEWKKDTGPYFDNLGIDALFVDEAHEYKNLWFRTKMGRIPGVKVDYVQKTFDMYMKTEYLNSVTGGKNLIFATGTPISNSLGELFTLQRYLAPGMLAERNIESFDSWATSFGEVVRKAETTPTGEGVRMHARFSKFTNIPELVQMFRSFADVKMAKDLNLPRPEIIGGEPKVVVSKKSRELHDYVWSLVERAEAIKSGTVEPWQDNMLNITTDGQKAAIDMRLVDRDNPDHPYSKANKCARNVFNIWKAYADENAAQIIWCDFGVPNDNRGKKEDSDKFPLYGDIKHKLVSLGIPSNEIAFVHSFKNEKRDNLFKAVRQGKIRVVIASTRLMGTGANVQDRLIAAHHLDAPWKPAELEQRDGRIIRQGNIFEKHGIYVFRYVSKGSFDAYRWQTLENKAHFIYQIMSGDVGIREAEDISEDSLSYAAAKACACGNPKIFRMVELEAQVRTLRNEMAAHQDRQFKINQELAMLPEKRKYAEKYKLKALEDKQYYENQRDPIKATESGFEIKIGQTVYTDRLQAGKVLTAMIEAQVQGGAVELPIAMFGDFKFKIQKEGEDYRAFVTSPNEIIYFGLELAHDPAGNITRLLNWFEKSFDGRVAQYDSELDWIDKRQKNLLERRGLKWEKEDELKEKESQLTQIQAELQVNQHGANQRQEKPPYIEEIDNEDGFSGRSMAAAYPFAIEAGGPATQVTAPIETQNEADPMVLGAKELVTLASGLMEGKFPTVHRRLKIHRGRAAGVFYPAQPVGKIGLRADIAIGPIIRQARVKRGTEEFAITAIMAELLDTGLKTSDIHIAKNRDRSSGKTILSFYRKDLQYAAKIIAHEIGHLIDWLPDHVTTRGNILGKIATLRGYLKHIIAALPDHPEDTLEDSIRRRLKRQANTSARKQNPKASSEDLKKTASEIYKQLLEKELANRNLISKQQITEELKNLTLWWNPFNPQQNDNYAKYRFKPSELYAEAMSVLLTNPAALRLKAPRFYDAFFAYLDEKPAVKELYEKINDELRTGSFEDNNVARVLESFRTADNQLRKEWAGEKFSTSEAMLAFKVLLMDTHAAIKGKAALSRRRGKLDPALDPEYAIEAATYSGAERELYLDRLRNEVAVLLEKNNVDWDLFDLYLMHKRNIHDRAEKLNPWGYNAKTSAEAIEKMRQRLGPVKMAAIERAQKSFWKLRQELVISKVEESSVFSDDLRNKIADNEHYAHFSVIDYLDAQYGKGNGIHIYKAVGTVKPIMGPATATVMQDLSLMTSINWNSAKLSVMDFLLSDFADEIAEADKVWANGKYQFIPPKDKDKVLLVGMFKGQFQGYYVNKWVGEAFDRGDYKAIKVAASIARAIGAPFRALFTGMRPGFWLFNMLRDYMRAVKNLPKANLRRFGGHWLRAWIPAAQSVWGHPTPIVQEMLHDQMLISIADVDRLASEDRQINRLLNMYTGAPLKFYNKFTRPFVGLFRNFMRISQTIERVPKIAGYTYLRENFPQMSDEQVAHIVRNQVGSPSFITRGSATWFTNNLFLFSNAMIQGWRSDIEVMTQSKGEAVFKLAKYTILPKAIMWALSSGAVVKLMGLMGGGDDDDTVKWFKAIQQLYLNIPEYDKTNYTCIPYGRTSGGKTKYLRVPTDEGQRFFAGVFYKMMNLPQNGIDTFPQTLDYTAGQLPGLNPAFKIASVVWDYIAGRNPYDTFRNQYVMPETLFNARNTKSHIAMLKWVANESGASIIQRFNLDTMDKPATATEKIISMPVSSDIIGRFIKVSDYGRREALKKVSGDTERKRARELLELRDIAIKLAKGEKLSGKEQSLADKNQQYLKHRTKLAQAKVEGDTYANELLYARSTAERYAMQKRIMEIEGPGFDITPYIESDIVDHSQVLARKIPIKTAERHAHDAQVQEALEWLRERNVPDDTVLKLYRQSVSKMKDKNAAGHNIQRVRVQLNKLGITSKKRSA